MIVSLGHVATPAPFGATGRAYGEVHPASARRPSMPPMSATAAPQATSSAWSTWPRLPPMRARRWGHRRWLHGQRP